jgi:prepilin-type processing-associated H-X9-DG protein
MNGGRTSAGEKATMQLSQRRLTGFTLLELLVILVVVGALVVLLVPKFTSTSEEKKRAMCASNLRQIGIAMFAYAGDNNGHFPTSACNRGATGCDPVATGYGGQLWDVALMNGHYISMEAFVCPADPYLRPPGKLPRSYALSSGAVGMRNHYWVQGSRTNCPGLTPETVLVGERPFEVTGAGCVLGEGPYEWGDATHFATAHFNITDFKTPETYIRSANYLFVDGRVAWVETVSAAMFPTNPCNPSCATPCP